MIHSIIFGFGHKARHGKDTAAAAIKEARSGCPKADQMGREYDIRIYSFAGELKREVNEAALEYDGSILRKGIDPINNLVGILQLFGKKNTLGVSVKPESYVQVVNKSQMDMSDPLCPYGKHRELLQWWGTEFRRNVDQDYWVNKVKARLAEEKPEIALITDVRFPNEIAFIEEYGETIKVVRPGITAVNEHVSEKALDHLPDSSWSAVIVNDGSLEDLKRKAVNTFDALLSRVPADRQALKAA